MVVESPARTAQALLRAQRPIERICYLIGAALMASGVVHLAVFAVDGGPFLGPVSWRKPVTFGLSFGLTLISVTWVASYLQLPERMRNWLLGIFAVDSVVEVAGITLQAWRKVPSHLNTETPFNAAVAFSLAFGGLVLVLVLGLLAVTALGGRIDGPPSMRLALRAGFALLAAGLAAGIAMIARGEVLIKSGHRTEGYDSAGFLKLFHGVTLHAVLVLPLLAWLLARTSRTEEQRTTLVARAAGLYVAVAVVALAVSLIRM